MDIHIDRLESTIRAVDGDALLAPETLRRIVAAVLEAVHEREEHAGRVEAERRTGGGVWEDQVGAGRST